MKIKYEDGIYKIYEQEQIGSVEFELETRYIQNIFLNKLYRNRGYLRRIIEYLDLFHIKRLGRIIIIF